jgi:assimilatory nitrate reductase catalytic subunit
LSKQPELKHSGVRLEAVNLPWQLFALIEGNVQQHFETLRPLCEAFSYVSLSLVGRERPALLIRAASSEAPNPQLLGEIDQCLSLIDGPVLAYDDPRRSIGKRVRIENGRITAIRLAGETLCNCKNVSLNAVCAGIRQGLDLQGLKNNLGCGTQCGSCVPEIKRLLAADVQPVAVI